MNVAKKVKVKLLIDADDFGAAVITNFALCLDQSRATKYKQ